MRQYESKVVLITGGGGGIGKAAARRFLDEGASVVLSGTRGAKLEAARAELDPSGERVAIHAGQVTTREQAHALVDFAVERFGGVDVLVNSTGIFRVVPFLEQTEEHFEEALGSILRPTYWVSQAAVLAMRERGGGAIVNVGSMWALDADRHHPPPTRPPSRRALTKTLGRRGQPDDVVEAILFLAGGGASWITGTTLPVDGGVLAGRSPALHAEVEAAA